MHGIFNEYIIISYKITKIIKNNFGFIIYDKYCLVKYLNFLQDCLNFRKMNDKCSLKCLELNITKYYFFFIKTFSIFHYLNVDNLMNYDSY